MPSGDCDMPWTPTDSPLSDVASPCTPMPLAELAEPRSGDPLADAEIRTCSAGPLLDSRIVGLVAVVLSPARSGSPFFAAAPTATPKTPRTLATSAVVPPLRSSRRERGRIAGSRWIGGSAPHRPRRTRRLGPTDRSGRSRIRPDRSIERSARLWPRPGSTTRSAGCGTRIHRLEPRADLDSPLPSGRRVGRPAAPPNRHAARGCRSGRASRCVEATSAARYCADCSDSASDGAGHAGGDDGVRDADGVAIDACRWWSSRCSRRSPVRRAVGIEDRRDHGRSCRWSPRRPRRC